MKQMEDKQEDEKAHRDTSERERRSRNRVANDQGTGQGAATALSKLRMLERERASIAPRREIGN